MKKIFLSMIVCLAAMATFAQGYDNIKTFLMLTQYEKAKEELDKSMSNPKFTGKPEAYILKASIYSFLAISEQKKSTPEGDQLTADADAAFKKFREMDPSMALLSDVTYQNAVVNLYSSYYTSGYNDYAAKKWEVAYGKLKNAVAYSDLLIDKKIFPITIDTNVLVLAGVTAENSGLKNDAVKYYSRLADNKVAGDGFESVYRYLVSYYFQEKKPDLFEKYKTIGSELYPASDYFKYDKVDFAVGLESNFNGKLKAIEEVLAKDPNNFKANQVLGEIIFDTLNPANETAPLPANANDLEKKMVAAFNKAASLKAGYEIPYLYIGDHFINKAVKVDDERQAHMVAMKARTQPGQPNSKEDMAKMDALDKKYVAALEMARDPYEKAAAIFVAKGTLSAKDKQQYKKAVSYLGDIYASKKIMAQKEKSADATKWAAEEKKWNDTWESIK